MNRRVWLLVLVMALAFTGVVGAQSDYEPYLEFMDCPFPELDGVACGILVVPENRDDPESYEVEIQMAVVSSTGNGDGVPVLYLEGGPGGSPVYGVESFLDHPLRANHDIIIFDQRGTGFSYPSLNCYELEEDSSDDPLADCYERLLSEEVDLSAYNSAASAADMADLITTLGYEQVNLWGISYGTRLALTFMRDYPQMVNAVVIDSVFPPEVNAIETGSVDAFGAFDLILTQCEQDAACSATYPTLRDDFYTLIDSLNESPAVFFYDDGEDGYEMELYGDDILSAMFTAIYDSSIIPMMPYAITLMVNAQDDADYTNAYDLMQGYYTPEAWVEGGTEGSDAESVMESDMVLEYIEQLGDISDSEGMYASVSCVEEAPFESLDVGYEYVEEIPEVFHSWAISSLESALADCDTWAVEPSSDIEAELVLSDAPTLVIAGSFDPVTPPSYALSALEGLSAGVYLEFPTGSHSETGLPGCGADITAAFFADPAAPLDTSCVPQAVAWYVGD